MVAYIFAGESKASAATVSSFNETDHMQAQSNATCMHDSCSLVHDCWTYILHKCQ